MIMNFIRYTQTEKDMCTFFHIWIFCYTIDAIPASVLFNGMKLTCVLGVGLWSVVSINFAECQYFIPHHLSRDMTKPTK